MKILLDENVAVKLKKQLKEVGYEDVVHINDIRKGMRDEEVYNLAKSENRLIISGDDDFKKKKFKLTWGIIYLTPKAKLQEDLSIRIKWIIDNISNYNINIFETSISLSMKDYNIYYRKGMDKEIKNKIITFDKIKIKKTSS